MTIIHELSDLTDSRIVNCKSPIGMSWSYITLLAGEEIVHVQKESIVDVLASDDTVEVAADYTTITSYDDPRLLQEAADREIVLDVFLYMLQGSRQTIREEDRTIGYARAELLLPEGGNTKTTNLSFVIPGMKRFIALEDSVHSCVIMHDMHTYFYEHYFIDHTSPPIDLLEATGMDTFVFQLRGTAMVDGIVVAPGTYVQIDASADYLRLTDDSVTLTVHRMGEHSV